MTAVIWLLIPLLLAALTGCLAALGNKGTPLNDPHPFETDPFTDDGDHRGRHEHPGEGPTVRLGDSWLRPPQE